MIPHRLLLLFSCSLLLFTNHLYSQNEPVSTCLQNRFCNYNLSDTSTSLPFASVMQDLGINYGKYTASATYPGDVKYQDENDKQKPCTSASTACDTNNNGALHYDVYYPSDYTKNQYAQCPLPAVIYVHGGGFSDCSVLSLAGNDSTAIAFARRGFIVFNVEYRNGRRLSPDPKNYPYITVQQQLAVYRALQDITGAIRSIIRRQSEHDVLPVAQRTQYQIDTNYLFLGGNSAGAITALGVAYYSRQSMLDSLNPHSGSVSILQALGPVNADYYYGDTTIKFRSKIRCVLAQWGSLSVPPNYDSSTAYQFFDQRIPVICFHGLKDPIVYPYIRKINFAPYDGSKGGYKAAYSSESTCLINSPFITQGNLPIGPDFSTYGSHSYFQYILQPLGIRREIYFDCDAKHGLDADGVNFKSDYGIGNPLTDYSTVRDVNLYIAGRAATFFQSIIGNSPATSHKIFFECPNRRISCSQVNDDGGCQNNDDCSTHPHQ